MKKNYIAYNKLNTYILILIHKGGAKDFSGKDKAKEQSHIT